MVAFVNASALSDGVHVFAVLAPQTDGLMANSSLFFSSNAQAIALKSQLQSELGALGNAVQSLNATVGLLDSRLKSTSVDLFGLAGVVLVLGVLTVVSVVVAAFSLRRGERAETHLLT